MSPEHFSGMTFAYFHLMSSLKDNFLVVGVGWGHPVWNHQCL